MDRKDLDTILQQHKLWIDTVTTKGLRANLQGADLQCANLYGADLQGANLQCANLKGANLQCANLKGANLDYSITNLSCKDLGQHIDDRLAIQRLFHLLHNVKFSANVTQALKDLLLTPELIGKANEFHEQSVERLTI